MARIDELCDERADMIQRLGRCTVDLQQAKRAAAASLTADARRRYMKDRDGAANAIVRIQIRLGELKRLINAEHVRNIEENKTERAQ